MSARGDFFRRGWRSRIAPRARSLTLFIPAYGLTSNPHSFRVSGQNLVFYVVHSAESSVRFYSLIVAGYALFLTGRGCSAETSYLSGNLYWVMFRFE